MAPSDPRNPFLIVQLLSPWGFVSFFASGGAGRSCGPRRWYGPACGKARPGRSGVVIDTNERRHSGRSGEEGEPIGRKGPAGSAVTGVAGVEAAPVAPERPPVPVHAAPAA